jgi:hypothetical protein
MEIANIQKSQNSSARDFYTKQAFGNRGVGAIHAYVGSVKDEDIIANKYTVFVPSWGYTYLYKVPRVVPSGKVSTNGVGYRPAALMPGQPVLLKYFEGTNQVYIDGSIHLPGSQQNKIPDESNSFLNAPFDLYNLVDSFAEVDSTPLLIGNSTTGTFEGFVSGNHKIAGSNGNVIQNLVGDCFTQTRNINIDVKGQTVSKAEAEVQKAIITVKRLRHNIERNYETVYSASDGTLKIVRRYVPQVNDVVDRVNRAYNTVRNIGIKIERVLELVKEASVITREQIRWLQEDLKPYIINTAQKWGLQDRVFNASIGGGIINISARGNLASNFKLTAKVNTGIPFADAYFNKQLEGLLGGFKLNTNLEIAQHLTKLLGFLGSGVSDQSIVAGRPPFPIQLQGGLFFGAYRIVSELQDIYNLTRSLLDVVSSTRGQLRGVYSLPPSRYLDLIVYNIGELEGVTSPPNNQARIARTSTLDNPSDNPPRLTRTNSPTPYLYIDPELNKLNDNQQPELGLAALLTKYGVPNSLDIVNDTLSLRSNEITTTAVIPKVLSNIAVGEEKIVMETAVLWLLKEVVNELKIVKAKDEECRVPVSELQEIVAASVQNNQPVVKDILTNYFLLDHVPDSYDEWAFNKESILDWLKDNNSDMLLTASFLVKGDLTRFFIELIYLTTGNDLILAPSELPELVQYINRVFNLVGLGVD